MKSKYILFGLLALMAASCTNDDLNEVAEMKQNGIQVTAGLTANTRVNFEQDGNVTHALWEEGDQITLYAPSQGYLPYQVSTLSEDAASATFTPINDALQNTDEAIYAAHRADMEADIADGMATLPNTDTWTDEHPLPFAYAISKVADGKLNLSFEHVFAYLKLTLNAETVAGSTNKSIAVIGLSTTSDEPLSNIYGFFNIPEQEYVIEKGSNHMFFTLQEPFTATGTDEKSVYIPILPQSAGKTITINIFGDYEAADTLFTESKEVPSTGFVAGRAYTYSPKSSITRVGNTVTLTEAGTLSQAISATEKDTITSLKIIGPLNGDDIRFIREMAGRDVNGNETTGKLTYLDISEASIVAGGGYYYLGEGQSECWAYDNNLGQYMFSATILNKILLPVSITLIGDCAFNSCTSLTDIIIPDGVTRIGGHAFRDCTELSDVKIGNNVTEIRYAAFLGCSSLININIPNSVTFIEDFAFSECTSLKNITLPNNVTVIGMGAFQKSALTSIDLPDNITSIAEQTFYGCSSLTTIEIPESVTSIGRIAFNDCQSLTEVTSLAVTPPTLGDGVFSNIASSATLNVPSGTYSAYMASDWAQYFTTIDDGEEHGGSYENGVATVVTAGTLSTLIPEDEKYTITTLKVVGPLNGDDIRFIREMAGRDVEGNETEGQLVDLDMSEASIVEGGDAYLSELVLGNRQNYYTTNNELGESMFEETILEQIYLPKDITLIGFMAFRSCSSLSNVNIAQGVTKIDVCAFALCSALASITIPNSVTSLGREVFYECSLLANVNLPESLEEIGNNAFAYCSSLGSINIPSNVTLLGTEMFYNCSSLGSVTLPESLVTLGDRIFFGCSSLTSVNIPRNVTTIAYRAFGYCSSLAEVTCNATTPPTLDSSVFEKIASPAILYVPSGTYAAYMASDWAQYFTTIDDGEEHGSYENGVATVVTAGTLSTLIPENEKYTITTLKVVGPLNGDDIRFIREMAGMYIDNQVTEGVLVDLDLSEAIITTGGDYYYNDTSISTASYNYVQHDNTIGNWMFTGLNLKNIILPSSVTEISYHAFESCSLETLTIPDSVTTIADFAFCSNRWLTTVTIGAGVTSIGRSCFYYSTSLAEVICNAVTPPTLDDTGVFSNIAESATLYVPSGCKAAYSSSSWADWFTTIEEVTR